MKPHKHAAFIKAWAEGAEIEYRHPAHEVVRSTRIILSNDIHMGDIAMQVPSDSSMYNLELTFEDGKLIAANVLK